MRLPGASAVVGAAGAYSLARVLAARPGRRPSWQAVNHRGASVSLAAGPALAAGALAAAAPALRWPGIGRTGAGVLLAATVGRLDDLGHDPVRGLRGHLRALAAGQLTWGGVKLAVLPVAGWLAVDPGAGPVQRGWDAVLVAASANLVNALDVRPGRALKAVVLVAGALAGGVEGGSSNGKSLALATGAAAGSLLPGDLAERWMLGDCGAAAAGTLLGAAAVGRVGPRGRRWAVVALAALTLLAERVSLSRLIEACAPLRAVDGWGRAPRGQAPRVTMNARGRAGRRGPPTPHGKVRQRG